MDISHFRLDKTWKPSESEKKRLFEIPGEVSKSLSGDDKAFVDEFSELLKEFKNVIAVGGDGFSLLFYNSEPI